MTPQTISKPKIILSTLDVERIEQLLDGLPHNRQLTNQINSQLRDELEAELRRAEVVDPMDMPATVVTMNSTVKFKVASSPEEFELTLVYPKDLDSSGKKISILAPIGSALLGLSQGDQIQWPTPDGGVQQVSIQEITYQPERNGEYHR
nr:nucleoside diphosphate kinase regulator [uncultured Undibacterium sp.]